MSKMSDLYINIMEYLRVGLSIDDIVVRTGAPYDWVVSVQNYMETCVMENDYED